MMIEMVAKTLYGLEEVLAGELGQLGASDIRMLNRAVAFRGDTEILYKANYCLRTALKVLLPIGEQQVENEQGLYDYIRSIRWENYLKVNETLAVEVALNTNLFSHSQFIAQRIKDAVVDRFRDKYGNRPSVDLDRPVLRINAFVDNKTVIVSRDSSGDPLFKRGYRIRQGPAPLNEVLAAGLIRLAGWDAKIPFVDFMCGSGTLPIEAALMARSIPPGISGRNYGFQQWNDYEPQVFEKMKTSCTSPDQGELPLILASDIHAGNTRLAMMHARKAGVEGDIRFTTADFHGVLPPEPPGLLLINPPYGERVVQENLEMLYKSIGDRLKKAYQGYTAWIFSGNASALKSVGLQTSRKIILYNGPLECRLQRYALYEGSKKGLFTKN